MELGQKTALMVAVMMLIMGRCLASGSENEETLQLYSDGGDGVVQVVEYMNNANPRKMMKHRANDACDGRFCSVFSFQGCDAGCGCFPTPAFGSCL